MGPKFDLRDRPRGPAFFGTASVVVSIALAAVGVAQVSSSRSTLLALDRIDVANAEANELERLLIDTDAALRGFVVTGDRTFLEPRTAALAVLDNRFDELEAHLATDPAQLERVRSIRSESVQHRKLGDRILALRESGGDAAALIASNEGKRSTDRMRATFQEIVSALGTEHERRSASFQASRWQPLALLGGLLLVGSLAQALLAQTFTSLRSRAVLALERERLATQLETQKRWLETVIEQSPAGIAIAESPTGRILYRSATMFGWLGTRPTTGAIADYASLHAERPDGRRFESDEYPIARALQGEHVVEDLVWRRPDGSSTSTQTTASPVRDAAGAIVGAIAIGLDLSERKRFEETLRESERREREARQQAERSAALLDSFLTRSPLGACVLDVEGRYLLANDALAAIVGLRAAELVGRTVRDVIAEPPLRAQVEGLIRRIVETGEPVVDFELEGKPTPESAEVTYWLVTYYPIKSSAGTVTEIGVIVHDVTARKRAERALEESEGRERTSRLAAERSAAAFDAFMSASPIAACVVDSELRYVFANASYAASVGSTVEDLPGRSVRDVLPHELVERVEPHIRDVLESRTAVSGIEIRGKRKTDSEEQTFQAAYFPIGTGSGPPLGVGALVQNVTGRKKAEEALRESERRERAARETAERSAALLDAFMSASPIGTSVLDLDLRIVRMNDVLATILGRPAESVVGLHPWQLMPPELAARVEPLLRRARAGETVSGIEIHGRAKPSDPEDQHFLASYVPIKSATGELLGVGSLVRDVTERKRADAALHASEQRERAAKEQAEHLAAQLDGFLAASPVGFALLDTDLRYTRLNPALAETNGVTIEATLGRRPSDILPPDLAAVAEPLLRSVLETREPIVNLELVGRTTESTEERCWLATYYPVTTRGGVLLGVGGVVQEITDRKRAEALLEELLAKEQEARREAERATGLRDEFLAVVSHDLRTPLASILLSASFLLSERRGADDVAPSAERIRVSARRMDRMIQDLLDVARVEAGRIALQLAPVSATDILREAYDAHAPLAEKASLQLDAEVPDVPVEARCDRGRVLQILANLIGNAIKFTPAGGTVALASSATDDELVFSVADSGPGIDEHELPHVFERFWQAQRGRAGGLGLGLYIAKALVELQGGRIWVESGTSRDAVGATFRFTLPRVRGARTAREPR